MKSLRDGFISAFSCWLKGKNVQILAILSLPFTVEPDSTKLVWYQRTEEFFLPWKLILISVQICLVYHKEYGKRGRILIRIAFYFRNTLLKVVSSEN